MFYVLIVAYNQSVEWLIGFNLTFQNLNVGVWKNTHPSFRSHFESHLCSAVLHNYNALVFILIQPVSKYFISFVNFKDFETRMKWNLYNPFLYLQIVMGTIRHSLQTEIFRPIDERLNTFVHVYKPFKKKKTSNFLCLTVTKEPPIVFYIHQVTIPM